MTTEAGKVGTDTGENEVVAIQRMSSLYDMQLLNISGETDDVAIATRYPGMILVNIVNQSASDPATVIVKTAATPGTELSLKIGQYKCYPIKLPEIATIVKTGTSDTLVLCFQKQG
jgi:hypothetical protein